MWGGSREGDRPSAKEMLRNENLESLRAVEPAVRKVVENAITALGYKATVGDVAAKAGVTLSEAQRALQALAADTHGTLQVSADGEILYALPSNFRSALAAKSLVVRAEPVISGIQKAAAYLVRIAFGTTLIASVVLVWVTLLALMSAASSSSDRDDRRGSSFSMPVYFNIGDLLWYMQPGYRGRSMRTQRGRGRGQEGPGLLEGIFSFVFGDGDPNEGLQERRWQLVGQYIQSRGGVVAAEEILPFLDPEEGPGELEGIGVDESAMMPVLLRFGGEPRVDDRGHVLYAFPSLQSTGRKQLPPPPSERAVTEQRWKLTRVDKLGLVSSVGLGILNLVGIVGLATQLAAPQTRLLLARSSLGFVYGLLPWLSVYAVAYFAIPAGRAILNALRNRAIEARNAGRLRALRALGSPNADLQYKLSAARRAASSNVFDERRVMYRTDSASEEQPRNWEMDDFDAKLRAANGAVHGAAGGENGKRADEGAAHDDWRQQMWESGKERRRQRAQQ